MCVRQWRAVDECALLYRGNNRESKRIREKDEINNPKVFQTANSGKIKGWSNATDQAELHWKCLEIASNMDKSQTNQKQKDMKSGGKLTCT